MTDVAEVPKAEPLQADTISYRLGGTGLTLRDNDGRLLGTLKLVNVPVEDESDLRTTSEELIERVRLLLTQQNHTTALVLPQHK